MCPTPLRLSPDDLQEVWTGYRRLNMKDLPKVNDELSPGQLIACPECGEMTDTDYPGAESNYIVYCEPCCWSVEVKMTQTVVSVEVGCECITTDMSGKCTHCLRTPEDRGRA